MIEQVLNRRNVMRAYRQVVTNKGSAGVDGMPVRELYKYLTNNKERIETELRQGKYQPQVILGVEIPKSNGKTRLLGIPTVIDRLLQQAVGQVIAIKFEMEFEKSEIRKPVNFTIQGFGFVPTYVKGERGKYQLVVSDKSWKSLKQKLKTITRKTTPSTFDERIQKLREVSQGWLNYFRMASIRGKLKELDGWLRNRLRYCIWSRLRREKKPERKRKNLIRLGVAPDHAYQWSRTRMGGWAVAQSPILVTTITLERLHKRGYEAMLEYYEKIAPHLNEPLYTRTVRTVV